MNDTKDVYQMACKCEGCGAVDWADKFKKIHVTNGALMLCVQCLSDINRKNPELVALRAENAALHRYKHLFECLTSTVGAMRDAEDDDETMADAFINVWLKLHAENERLVQECERLRAGAKGV